MDREASRPWAECHAKILKGETQSPSVGGERKHGMEINMRGRAEGLVKKVNI